MTDISVILPGESKYEINFCRQVTNLRVMVDFMQKMDVFEAAIFDIFDFRTPSSPKQVTDPLNQYIFRKYTPWPYSYFLNFSKIFYNKKFFLVPPEGCQIVKMLNFDPHLAPPTFGGGTWSPHFFDQGPWVYPPYKFGPDPGYFCNCPATLYILFGLFKECVLRERAYWKFMMPRKNNLLFQDIINRLGNFHTST